MNSTVSDGSSKKKSSTSCSPCNFLRSHLTLSTDSSERETDRTSKYGRSVVVFLPKTTNRLTRFSSTSYCDRRRWQIAGSAVYGIEIAGFSRLLTAQRRASIEGLGRSGPRDAFFRHSNRKRLIMGRKTAQRDNDAAA